MDLDQLQREHNAWCTKNFGSSRRPIWGVIEEVGELARTCIKSLQGIRGTKEEHEAKAKDAVGDIMIYLTDFLTLNDYSLSTIVEAGIREENPSLVNIQDIAYFTGLLSHQQNSKHQIGKYATILVARLNRFCELRKWSLVEILFETWAEVKKRDWKANPKTGQV